jgi:hypothetical protein
MRSRRFAGGLVTVFVVGIALSRGASAQITTGIVPVPSKTNKVYRCRALP